MYRRIQEMFNVNMIGAIVLSRHSVYSAETPYRIRDLRNPEKDPSRSHSYCIWFERQNHLGHQRAFYRGRILGVYISSSLYKYRCSVLSLHTMYINIIRSSSWEGSVVDKSSKMYMSCLRCPFGLRLSKKSFV